MSDRTYRVIVTRDDGAWLADVPELEGTHTYARNLSALDSSVREVIAMVEDLPDGAEPDLKIAYEYHTGDPQLDEAAAQLREARERVRIEEQRVARQTVELAKAMVDNHRLSVRDAAALIGVAPQRISQVAPSLARRRERKSGREVFKAREAAGVDVVKNPQGGVSVHALEDGKPSSVIK